MLGTSSSVSPACFARRASIVTTSSTIRDCATSHCTYIQPHRPIAIRQSMLRTECPSAPYTAEPVRHRQRGAAGGDTGLVGGGFEGSALRANVALHGGLPPIAALTVCAGCAVEHR